MLRTCAGLGWCRRRGLTVSLAGRGPLCPRWRGEEPPLHRPPTSLERVGSEFATFPDGRNVLSVVREEIRDSIDELIERREA